MAIFVSFVDNSIWSMFSRSSAILPAIHMVDNDFSFLVFFTVLVSDNFMLALKSAVSVHTHDIISVLSCWAVVSVVRTFVDVLEWTSVAFAVSRVFTSWSFSCKARISTVDRLAKETSQNICANSVGRAVVRICFAFIDIYTVLSWSDATRSARARFISESIFLAVRTCFLNNVRLSAITNIIWPTII